MSARAGLIRLRPRDEALYVSRGRTVLVTGRDGFVHGDGEQGFYCHLTRLLSRYRYLINGEPPRAAGLSNVDQHSWLGYYIAPPQTASATRPADTSELTEQTLELRLCRTVSDGMHEDVDLTNFTTAPVSCVLEIEIDADFAGIDEVRGGRVQRGRRSRRWRGDDHTGSLVFDYRARHRFEHDGERGVAGIWRGVAFRVDHADSPPAYGRGRLRFEITLMPRAVWRACLTITPLIDGRPVAVQCRCRSFGSVAGEYDRRTETFLADSTRYANSLAGTLTPVVTDALERARQDLADLRLFDLDTTDGGWVAAAGLPVYLALFGRDSLTAAWQSALMTPQMMTGTLQALARLQGVRTNNWRDEEPGRMLHQADTSPSALLNYTPLARYYGSITTSGFYPVAVSELWHWTGNRALVQQFVEPALNALRWLDMYSDVDRDGFYEYQTHSARGLVNQGWKDSGDSIVHEDGSVVHAPIATSEEQAFVYLAKLHMAEVLWWLDRKDEAHALKRQADELKERFHDTFWMDDLGFVAMALGPDKRPVRSIGSNAIHVVATGILHHELAGRVVNRLLAPDMFSGWGVRTLSANHPSYNPYSYHRGSIWPVEHGAFAIGLLRYGLHDALDVVCRGMFDLAALFDSYRLPELCAGHQRSASQPFPALYPAANWPQAWSSSAVFCFVQALTGIYPYAPLNMLFVDPHLPPWLPAIAVERLHVGDSVVSLHFRRHENGHSAYEVMDKQGPLHVIRQPSPWSLTATPGERLRDIFESVRTV